MIAGSRHADLWTFGVVAGAVAVLCYVAGEFRAEPWANHDVANALYVGARVFAGDVLYVDWNYFVMPSVVFLSSAAVAIADVTTLHPQTVMHLMLVGCALLGAAVIRRALPEPSARRSFALLAELCLLVSCGVSAHNFAQREHFFALLLVPHLLWRSSGRADSPSVLLLAVGLGFTAMIKPHFVAGVVLLEVWYSFGSQTGREPGRKFRFGGSDRRHWIALAAGAVLPLALLALRPEAVAGMFERMIPYQTGSGYQAYDAPFQSFFGSPLNERYIALLALIGVGSALAIAGRAVSPAAGFLNLAAPFFFYAAFLQQQKFFDYHAIPFLGTAYLALASLAGAAVERLAAPWKRVATFSLTAGVLVWIGFAGADLARKFETRTPPALQRALTELGDARLVALFTPSVELGFYSWALQHDVEVLRPWTSHYTFPPLVGIADPLAREAALRAYMAPVLARIEVERPEAVLFSPSQHSLGSATMHGVIVGELGLFPTPAYRLQARTPQGWVVYRLIERD